MAAHKYLSDQGLQYHGLRITTGIRVWTEYLRQVQRSSIVADLFLLLGPFELQYQAVDRLHARQFMYEICRYGPVRNAVSKLAAKAKSEMTRLLTWQEIHEMVLQAVQNASTSADT